MKPIVEASPEQTRAMNGIAGAIIAALTEAGHGRVSIATILVGTLCVLHQAGDHEYRLELETYLAANLEQMRKMHQ